MTFFELDYEHMEEGGDEEVLFFIRAVKSKLFRLNGLPPSQRDNAELTQVLNTLAVHGGPLRGVWYFRLRDHEEWQTFAATLYEMQVPAYFVEKDMEATITAPRKVELLN